VRDDVRNISAGVIALTAALLAVSPVTFAQSAPASAAPTSNNAIAKTKSFDPHDLSGI